MIMLFVPTLTLDTLSAGVKAVDRLDAPFPSFHFYIVLFYYILLNLFSSEMSLGADHQSINQSNDKLVPREKINNLL